MACPKSILINPYNHPDSNPHSIPLKEPYKQPYPILIVKAPVLRHRQPLNSQDSSNMLGLPDLCFGCQG